jgi:hypothetical protein
MRLEHLIVPGSKRVFRKQNNGINPIGQSSPPEGDGII